MNKIEKQDYFALLEKWFRIYPESIVHVKKEEEINEVELENKEME